MFQACSKCNGARSEIVLGDTRIKTGVLVGARDWMGPDFRGGLIRTRRPVLGEPKAMVFAGRSQVLIRFCRWRA
jgi:hypothetical protein